MSVASIDEKQVLEALRHVPPERWQEVLKYLRSLQLAESENANAKAEPIRTAADLARSSLVGLWADRDELTDSHKFARQLREQAEHREGVTHVAGQ